MDALSTKAKLQEKQRKMPKEFTGGDKLNAVDMNLDPRFQTQRGGATSKLKAKPKEFTGGDKINARTLTP